MNKTVKCKAWALVIRSLPEVGKGTDTGKRMIRDQLALQWALTEGGAWAYVDAPAGRGWVAKEFLEETTSYYTSPSWPMIPSGLREIIVEFGRPGQPVCQAGRVNLPDILPLSWAPGQAISTFACHKLVEDVMTSVFKVIHDKGLWDLLEDFGGCFNVRKIKASEKISTHAWGISVDLNTKTNPLGAVPKMSPRIVAVFEDHGFVWGGLWSRPDGMHFQRAVGY